MSYEFRVDLTVRSYECDIGGVVNNSVYLQYLEHAKCEWLKELGLNYGKMAAQSLYFVISKLNIDFKFPLKYGDDFWVGMNTRRPSDYHLEGSQNIYRTDGKLIMLSSVVAVFIRSHEISKLPYQIIEKYPLKK